MKYVQAIFNMSEMMRFEIRRGDKYVQVYTIIYTKEMGPTARVLEMGNRG